MEVKKMTNAPLETKDEIRGGAAGKLQGNMGVFDIVFTVLAYNAPISVFVGFITVIIGYGNGIGAPVTFIAAGLLMLVFAVGFTSMSRKMSNPGAFYSYITAGVGRPLGLGSAFLALVSYLFILIGGYCFGGLSWSALVRDRFGGPDIPWWVYTLAVMVIVSLLGYFRITLSAKLLTIVMILEIVAIIAYDLSVIAQGGDSGTAALSLEPFSFQAAASGSIGLAVIFGVVCFAGFEATAVFREEARDPNKTIPRATYISVITLMVIYALTSWAMVNGLGLENAVELSAADPTGTAFATTGVYLTKIGVDIVNVLLCTSIFAANLSTHNVSTRYIYSLSVDGVFPKFLSRIHHSEVSPFRASFLVTGVSIASLLVIVFLAGEPGILYATLVGIGGYALIMLLLLTSIGVIAYFRRNASNDVNVFKRLIAPLIAIIGLVVALVIATQNVDIMIGGSKELAASLVGLFVALIVTGVIVALVLRKTKPNVYERIGRQDV
jgi:amino acid transporter